MGVRHARFRESRRVVGGTRAPDGGPESGCNVDGRPARVVFARLLSGYHTAGSLPVPSRDPAPPANMPSPPYATPMDAEEAFYDAFERGDLEAMMQVWADDDGIVCIHPLGPRLQGRPAVEASWRQILGEGSRMRFEISGTHWLRDDELSVHCVHESIDFGPRLRQHSVVLATNAYRLTAQGWRMILHHASPGTVPDSLLPEGPHAVH